MLFNKKSEQITVTDKKTGTLLKKVGRAKPLTLLHSVTTESRYCFLQSGTIWPRSGVFSEKINNKNNTAGALNLGCCLCNKQ